MRAHGSAKLKPAKEEYTATAKFYPRETFPAMRHIFHSVVSHVQQTG